jgi:hypothetical protein
MDEINKTPNKIRVILTQKSDSILSDIVNKYNLQEGTEMEKIPKVIKIIFVAKDLARGAISEKDLAGLLQKNLTISQQTAEQIAKEIVINLVPTFKKISEEDLAKLSDDEKDALVDGQTKKTEEPPTLPKIKAPIGVDEILAKPQTQTNQVSSTINEEPLTKIELAKKRLKKEKGGQKNEEPVVEKSTKSDTYREPIA